MPRPPAELRKLEEEERRRANAHRRVRWGRRLRVALWILGGIGLLGLIALLARLAGFFPR
jgi:cell division septal protein FtsQ